MSSSSSLLALLQQWMQSENSRNASLHSLQQQERQDYEQMLKLVHEYQHTMAEYQSNMSTYLLLLASLQLRSFSASPLSSASAGSTTEPLFSTSTSRPHNQNQRTTSPLFSPSSSSSRTSSTSNRRMGGNRSYSTAAASSSAIRPLITRLRDTVQARMAAESSASMFDSFTEPSGSRATEENQSTGGRGEENGNSHDLSGNLRATSSTTSSNHVTNPWYTLFPPLNSNAVNTSLQGLGLGRNTETSSSPVNLIDIVFEYDEPLPTFTSPENESSLQRMIQSDDFRNQILRAAGLENRSNVMRWIVAPPHGLDDLEPRGMTNEQIRACTTNLVYSEGMEGLLSHVCPITMEEFVEGDRLLQLRECRHTFRERELVEWFQRHSTCPVCRTSYRG